MRTGENTNYRLVPFLPGAEQKMPKKLKNIIMASFQAKIGWKRPRNRKNINYRSVPFRSYTTRNRKFQKNSKKIKKVKKYHYGFISSQK